MPKKKPDFDLPEWEILAEPVHPDAAIEFWKQRAKLTDAEAKALGADAKQRAFYVTGLAKHDLVQLVSDGIQSALENGETLADFKKRIAAAIATQGWHDHRVENIFRTNMQTAYSAGRYKKMQAVKASRPYWQYLAILDKRVRPSHAILHELVYPADHEFWASNYPPNGFRCRCGVRTLSAKQVEKQGLTVQKAMPEPGVWTDPKTGMEYFVHFPGADKGFRNNPGKDWLAGLDLKKHGLENTAPPAPKKEPLTQKKLEADIASLDTLIKAGGDKKAVAELEAKKAECQALLDKKKALAAKKKLTKEQLTLTKQLEAIPVKTYSGLWLHDVTTADWKAKSGGIQAKKEYFAAKLAGGGLTVEETAKFKGLLQDLEEFDAKGQELHALQEKRQNVQASLSKFKKGGKGLSDPYSQERKDAALWAKSPEEADAVLREGSGAVWRKASKAEKDALYAYTRGSGGFNRPLRGYEGSWTHYKGAGKVDLNYEGQGAAIQHMTNAINKSTYTRDVWLQRGVGTVEGAAQFLGIKADELRQWTQNQLEKVLKGKPKTDHAFVSCGSAKGQGFKGVIFNIYCPQGTKMLYSEPFSHFGDGDGRKWDGISPQTSFGYEDETIIQRGTTFRITKVEKKRQQVFIDMEVVEQI